MKWLGHVWDIINPSRISEIVQDNPSDKNPKPKISTTICEIMELF
jgi:hypothetical protein